MNAPHLFLNISFPATAWAAGRGVLVPALAGKSENGWISVMLASLIRNEKINRIYNEQIIEAIRRKKYQHVVSRVTGLFYFNDEETARQAEYLWKIFNISELTEVEIIGDGPISRLDSNWYTFAPRNEHGFFIMEDIAWIDRYLSGDPMSTKPALWEYITENRINILNVDLKKRP